MSVTEDGKDSCTQYKPAGFNYAGGKHVRVCVCVWVGGVGVIKNR